MTRPLSRRALFAVPVALPVAALAAKVAPVKPFAMGGVVDPAKFAHIIGERGPEFMVPVRMEIDGAALRRVLKAEADRVISRFDPASYRVSAGMTPREGVAEAAKPVTAQAAAPVGGATSRSQEGDASDSVAPRQMAEPVVPTGNEGTSGERDTVAQTVAA